MRTKYNFLARIMLAFTTIFLLSIGVLQAKDFHVTTAAEFQNALTTARDNGEADTIRLAAGIYNASDNDYAFTYIEKEGEDYDLTIKGKAGTTADDVILDGNGKYEVLSIEQENASVNIEGITVRNGGGIGTPYSGIGIPYSGNVTITNSVVTGNAGIGMDIYCSGDFTLANNIIIKNKGKGVWASNSGNIIFTNNTITDNMGEGIRICSYSRNITLTNNIIIKNGSTGVYVMYSPHNKPYDTSANTILTNNTIRENKKSGLFITMAETHNIFYSYGNITLTNNNITDNMSVGVYIYYSSLIDATLSNNVITGNVDGGAFIWDAEGDVNISRNIIRKNGGKGLWVAPSGDITLINNNTITENKNTYGNGGGVFAEFDSGQTTILTNNTITRNETSQDGGGLYLYCSEADSVADIYNNIIWGNEAIEGEGNDICNDSHIYAIANVHNNNFHDTAGRPFTEDVDNIDDDPLFANPEQGDYRLLPGSPCIDKGTADAPELPTTDFEGDPRIIGSAPDIGADEFDPSAPPTTTSTTTTISPTTTTTFISPPPCLAEEIYGEYSDEAELLRYFHDNVLDQTLEGQEIIRLYYQWSPVIVEAMEEDEAFKEDVKEMIDGVLQSIMDEIK